MEEIMYGMGSIGIVCNECAGEPIPSHFGYSCHCIYCGRFFPGPEYFIKETPREPVTYNKIQVTFQTEIAQRVYYNKIHKHVITMPNRDCDYVQIGETFEFEVPQNAQSTPQNARDFCFDFDLKCEEAFENMGIHVCDVGYGCRGEEGVYNICFMIWREEVQQAPRTSEPYMKGEIEETIQEIMDKMRE